MHSKILQIVIEQIAGGETASAGIREREGEKKEHV